MARTFQTECANCGKEIEVDVSDDPGADAYSVHQRDDFCSRSCEEEAF